MSMPLAGKHKILISLRMQAKVYHYNFILQMLEIVYMILRY